MHQINLVSILMMYHCTYIIYAHIHIHIHIHIHLHVLLISTHESIISFSNEVGSSQYNAVAECCRHT